MTPSQVMESLTEETLGFMREVVGATLTTPSGSAPCSTAPPLPFPPQAGRQR
jgi:hypothetical protein